MADRNSFEENLFPPLPEQGAGRRADPFEPERLFTPLEEGELQWVLVPVTHADHAKRRRRVRMVAIGCLSVVTLFAAWWYKRTVDPIRALDEYDAGERYLKIARYPQAIVSFDRAISLKSDFADAYTLRGRANMELSKPRAALPDFSKAIELRPLDPIGFLDRGAAHLAVKEYTEALADFNRAIELDPKLARAYNLRGTVTRATGQTEKSLEDFDKAVELDANVDNLFQRGATYQALGDHEFAIQDFNRVIEYNPASAQPYFARSQSFRALGDIDSAEHDHEIARKLDGR